MPCYHPVSAYRSKVLSDSGKRPLVFNVKDAIDDGVVTISCGQCVGCRLKRSAEWATRCMHEASLYRDNCFITLTYSNDSLPDDRSLRLRDLQLFMKRLRKRFGSGIRFYACGEYGDRTLRPHYHAILFNHDFRDKKFYKTSATGFPVYRSQVLEELWPFGFSEIGSVTFESAAYVARYIMKKQYGKDADKHYTFIDDSTGELFHVKPEFTVMSRRPGIAKDWFDKFHGDVYPHDFVVVNGVKRSPPKFYDSQFEVLNPFGFDEVKHNRYLSGLKYVDNSTPERLAIREEVQKLKLAHLKRTLD